MTFNPDSIQPDTDPIDDTPLGLENEDWMRSLSWDITVRVHGNPKIVETLPELRMALAQMEYEHDGVTPADDRVLANFLTLPAAKPMPQAIRDALPQGLANAAPSMPRAALPQQ